ncbi:hypothetical protein DNU06_07040 [Putridiphycobacter roseus]|uniref:Uncharacterized protein n=1 Tax=Putridiphycobacter roseus TaxID=2219161 RepID=A0A2W1N051_9FLAO|nr:hypothetical protein DNU06_07040 [Putridiphycobacter roseus]
MKIEREPTRKKGSFIIIQLEINQLPKFFKVFSKSRNDLSIFFPTLFLSINFILFLQDLHETESSLEI